MQRYNKSLIFPNILRNYSKGIKWNNCFSPKVTNFAQNLKKQARMGMPTGDGYSLKTFMKYYQR